MDMKPLTQAAQVAIRQGATDLGPVVTTAITKGSSTSEFKMAVVGIATSVLIGLGTALTVLPSPFMFIGAGILGGMSILGYTVSRGLAKSNAVPETEKTRQAH